MIAEPLSSQLRGSLSKLGFYHFVSLLHGELFKREDGVALAIDHNICDPPIFSYAEYSDEQNSLMKSCPALFRGMVNCEADVADLCRFLTTLLNQDYETEDAAQRSYQNRELSMIDPTAPEA